MSDEDIDKQNGTQWMQYAENVCKLLEDRAELLQSKNDGEDDKDTDDTNDNVHNFKVHWNDFIQNIQKSISLSTQQLNDGKDDNLTMERIWNDVNDDENGTIEPLIDKEERKEKEIDDDYVDFGDDGSVDEDNDEIVVALRQLTVDKESEDIEDDEGGNLLNGDEYIE